MNVTSMLTSIDAEIARLQEARAAIAAIAGLTKRGPGRPKGASKKAAKKRVPSTEARAKVAVPQKRGRRAVKKAK
jgi:hypothetical protein